MRPGKTISELMQTAGGFVKSSIERQILIAHVIKVRREFVVAHPEHVVSPKLVKGFLDLLKRRKKGEPVAYLIGHKEFFGMDFIVNKDVLVPRPETEFVVEEAIKCMRGHRGKVRVLDLGTGSGCIAVAIAKSVASSHVTAADISEKALRVARLNGRKHGVSKRMKFVQSNLLEKFLNLNIDVIVANLPYIPRKESKFVEKDVKKYEPSLALWGGDDGMRLLNKFFVQLARLTASQKRKKKSSLKYVIGEFGFSMKKLVQKSLKKYLPTVRAEFKKDYAGHDRIFILHFES